MKKKKQTNFLQFFVFSTNYGMRLRLRHRICCTVYTFLSQRIFIIHLNCVWDKQNETDTLAISTYNKEIWAHSMNKQKKKSCLTVPNTDIQPEYLYSLTRCVANSKSPGLHSTSHVANWYQFRSFQCTRP